MWQNTGSPKDTAPPPPHALNGWGRYVAAEVESMRRDHARSERRMDGLAERLDRAEATLAWIVEARRLAWKLLPVAGIEVAARVTTGQWIDPLVLLDRLSG